MIILYEKVWIERKYVYYFYDSQQLSMYNLFMTSSQFCSLVLHMK